MTRINTNVPSMIAQQRLNRSGLDLQVRLERLSTGLRINRGKDDPAGLIISERLGTDIASISQAIKNGERASSVIATTEGSLSEITDLLNSIKALAVEAANTGALSDEERAANQLQIDSAIQSITRISNTASFGGLKLLDGSLDYLTSGIVSTEIANARITSASFISSNTIDVDVDVLSSAQKGNLYLTGDNGGTGDGTILSQTTIQIRGPEGVRELVLQSGQTLSSVRDAVNNLTAVTGVEASLMGADSTSGLVFSSTDYGSNSFVSIKRVDNTATGNFQLQKLDANAPILGSAAAIWGSSSLVDTDYDEGADVSALINGILATGDGLNISINSPTLGMELLLAESFAIDPTIAASSFDITGGGALFQLGPDISALQQTNIGVQSTAAENLGGTLINGGLEYLSSLSTGNTNSLDTAASRNNFDALQKIVDNAIDEVSIQRGRLGAFERNVLDTNRRSLQSAFENLTASRSVIRDADFAAESSELTRVQILQSAGTSVLSLANQQSQQVLQLLG
ncbi:MAG: flagellin N-terminal helical domain-containing protein [Phycisphaerales bacterium]